MITKYIDTLNLNIKEVREENSIKKINQLLSTGWKILTTFPKDDSVIFVLFI